MKAILFDMDGTLIDSSEGITKSVQYALKHYGIEISELDCLKSFIGPPLADSFVRYYDFPVEQAREAVDVYRERYNVTGIFGSCKACLYHCKTGLHPEYQCRTD